MSSRPSSSLLRRIGVLYLLLALLGPFSMMLVPARLYVPGDPAASLHAVHAQPWLLRGALLADSVILGIEIVLTVWLVRAFWRVSWTGSGVAGLARASMAIVQAVNLGVLVLVLRFADEGCAEWLSLALEAHHDMMWVWQIPCGLHCATLGWLTWRASWLPRAIGVLLYGAGFGYLLDSFGRFAWSGYATHFDWLVAPLAAVGEMTLVVWLLWRGASYTRQRVG